MMDEEEALSVEIVDADEECDTDAVVVEVEVIEDEDEENEGAASKSGGNSASGTAAAAAAAAGGGSKKLVQTAAIKALQAAGLVTSAAGRKKQVSTAAAASAAASTESSSTSGATSSKEDSPSSSSEVEIVDVTHSPPRPKETSSARPSQQSQQSRLVPTTNAGRIDIYVPVRGIIIPRRPPDNTFGINLAPKKSSDLFLPRGGNIDVERAVVSDGIAVSPRGQLRPGDVVTAVNGNDVSEMNFSGAIARMKSTPPHRPLVLCVLRKTNVNVGTPSPTTPQSAAAAAYALSSGSSGGYKNAKGRKLPNGAVMPCRTPTKDSNGRYMRPPGRDVRGMKWDEVRGLWVPNNAQIPTAPVRVASGTVGSRPLYEKPKGHKLKFASWDGRRGLWFTRTPQEGKKRDRIRYFQPSGREPKDVLWDTKEGLWRDSHSSEPKKPPYKKPRGAMPKGKEWDAARGVYVKIGWSLVCKVRPAHRYDKPTPPQQPPLLQKPQQQQNGCTPQYAATRTEAVCRGVPPPPPPGYARTTPNGIQAVSPGEHLQQRQPLPHPGAAALPPNSNGSKGGNVGGIQAVSLDAHMQQRQKNCVVRQAVLAPGVVPVHPGAKVQHLPLPGQQPPILSRPVGGARDAAVHNQTVVVKSPLFDFKTLNRGINPRAPPYHHLSHFDRFLLNYAELFTFRAASQGCANWAQYHFMYQPGTSLGIVGVRCRWCRPVPPSSHRDRNPTSPVYFPTNPDSLANVLSVDLAGHLFGCPTMPPAFREEMWKMRNNRHAGTLRVDGPFVRWLMCGEVLDRPQIWAAHRHTLTDAHRAAVGLVGAGSTLPPPVGHNGYRYPSAPVGGVSRGVVGTVSQMQQFAKVKNKVKEDRKRAGKSKRDAIILGSDEDDSSGVFSVHSENSTDQESDDDSSSSSSSSDDDEFDYNQGVQVIYNQHLAYPRDEVAALAAARAAQPWLPLRKFDSEKDDLYYELGIDEAVEAAFQFQRWGSEAGKSQHHSILVESRKRKHPSPGEGRSHSVLDDYNPLVEALRTWDFLPLLSPFARNVLRSVDIVPTTRANWLRRFPSAPPTQRFVELTPRIPAAAVRCRHCGNLCPIFSLLTVGQCIQSVGQLHLTKCARAPREVVCAVADSSPGFSTAAFKRDKDQLQNFCRTVLLKLGPNVFGRRGIGGVNGSGNGEGGGEDFVGDGSRKKRSLMSANDWREQKSRRGPGAWVLDVTEADPDDLERLRRGKWDDEDSGSVNDLVSDVSEKRKGNNEGEEGGYSSSAVDEKSAGKENGTAMNDSAANNDKDT
uniref:PDZ domain-containing protein n=1 Tax=Odontella aurita TaxID=265563 RepID=A0A7S4IRW7_9STRA